MKILEERNIVLYWCDILFIIACTLMMSIPASYEPNHFAKALFVGSFFQSLSYTLLIFLLVRNNYAIRQVILTLLYILFFLETFTYIRFDSRLDPSIVTLILQTSPQETKEFLSIYLLDTTVLLSLLCMIVCYVLLFYILKFTQYIILVSFKKSLLIIPLLFILFGLSLFFIQLPFPLGNNTINELFISLQFVKDNHGELQQMEEMLDDIKIEKGTCNSKSPVIVLVIGESFNKYHSSLYGYSLPTSPKLCEEKRQHNLLVFNHAHTPTNGTSFAMKYLFTLKSCNSTDSSKYILMPAVFRRAGYKVGYFDNQYTRFSGGSLDYSCGYFLNPQRINNSCFDYRNNDIMTFDGDFVKKYKRIFFKTPGSLNIIHLKGQHFDAAQRYPSSFSRFSNNDIHRQDLNEYQRSQVAAYDNATLYNDHVISDILSFFNNTDAVIIYLSDHGEQIYDDDNHYFGRVFGSDKDKTTLKNVYQVPLMIWCSNLFIQQHPDKYNAIMASVNRSVCIDDIAYLMFDLADIDFNFNKPSRSMINSSYHAHETVIE